MSMLGKRSTESRERDTPPSTTVMSDIIRMKIGFRSASRVSHMAAGPLSSVAVATRPAR